MKKIMCMVTMLAMMLFCTTVFAEQGNVDWENGVVTATGYGVAPENVTRAGHEKILARRAAIVEAYRNLGEIMQGVNVDATSTVSNMMVASDVINTRVTCLIKNAKITDEKYNDDGTYEVTMQIRMFGSTGSLSSAVLPQHTTTTPFTSPEKTNVNKQQITTTGIYTGLIVDCREMGLRPAMSPVIKSANGESIYGYKNLDSKYVIHNGMAGYMNEIDNTNYGRAGNNPLIIKAVSLDNNNTYPVLSAEDATR